MRSIKPVLATVVVGAWAVPVSAQHQAQGFAVERLSLGVPGDRWFVEDELAWPEGLGAAVSLSLGYAHDPLVIQSTGPASNLAVVEHQAFADVGLSASYDRFLIYGHFSSPLRVAGHGGRSADFQFSAPAANIEQDPDTISDVRLGLDARLLGNATDPLRLGFAAELFFPSGNRGDYLTDDTYRGMARALFAGDAGRVSWAAHVGVHIRPLDESPVPSGPRGNEMVFGAAAALRLAGGSAFVGPEIYGATAFQSFFGSETTAVEALLTTRIEGRQRGNGRLGLKLGLGAGLHSRFGAPDWRVVLGIDLRSPSGSSNPMPQ